MKTLEQVLLEQIDDIKQMATKLEIKIHYKTRKQKEAAFKMLQQIQEKLYKLLNNK